MKAKSTNCYSLHNEKKTAIKSKKKKSPDFHTNLIHDNNASVHSDFVFNHRK
jgi:hypothetical protein